MSALRAFICNNIVCVSFAHFRLEAAVGLKIICVNLQKKTVAPVSKWMQLFNENMSYCIFS